MPAAKKTTKKDIPSSIEKGLGQIAKGMGVAVTELWTIFVKQYFAKGIATAIITIIPSVLIVMKYGPFFWESMVWWVVAIIVAGKILGIYWSVMYILNPHYYALEDITARLGQVMDKVKGNGKGGETTAVVASKSLEYRYR